MNNEDQMTQKEFAIVKLAAAERYRERNIRPTTASYLFDRALAKQAKCAAKPAKKKQPAKQAAPQTSKAASVKVAKINKLAQNLKKVLPSK